MKEKGTWYVPTLSAGRFVGEKALIDGYYPAIIRPKAIAVGAKIMDTFARAYRMGVPIAFGTDAGVSPHGDNAREFEFMVEGGMPANLALQTAMPCGPITRRQAAGAHGSTAGCRSRPAATPLMCRRRRSTASARPPLAAGR